MCISIIDLMHCDKYIVKELVLCGVRYPQQIAPSHDEIVVFINSNSWMRLSHWSAEVTIALERLCQKVTMLRWCGVNDFCFVSYVQRFNGEGYTLTIYQNLDDQLFSCLNQ